MTRRSLFGHSPPSAPPVAPPAGEPRIETASAVRRGSSESPFSVREISARVRSVLEDGFPRSCWLEGELSEVSRPASGHLYLSFREERTVLAAVAWASDARSFVFIPEPGDRVRAYGRLRAYEGKSTYQFYVQRLEKAGVGALLQELLEREARLEREGLFDPAAKRALPYLPLRIGLLTAAGSDAWTDFTQAARARFPGVMIREHFAPVQGPAAPAALAAGIAALGRLALDVIVVARGGGSVEDLLPFSDEVVVRAAAACPVPIVSAVGHEQNRPLLDRVADHRCSTPSAAARDLLPDRDELIQEIEARRGTAASAVRRVLQAAANRIATFRTHRATSALPVWLRGERQERRQDRSTATEAAHQAIRSRRERLNAVRQRLARNEPTTRLAEQFSQLSVLRERLARLPRLQTWRERLEDAHRQAAAEPLRRRLEEERATVADHRRRRDAALERRLERGAFLAGTIARSLADLDPRVVLRRGYSLALDAEGHAVVSSQQVRVGDRLQLLLGEGELRAAVEEVRPDRHPSGGHSAEPGADRSPS